MSSSSALARRRVVIVGIPGVGKSTVVSKVVEMLSARDKHPRLINYGTVMMEQATTRFNLKSRDEIRRLSVENQRSLQIYAAKEISKLEEEILFVDTHLFISTAEGFWPGIPMDVLLALKPTNLILVVAPPEDIVKRRVNDKGRDRDPATHESLMKEIEAATALLYASSVIIGCPALIVQNGEGEVENAAMKILDAII